MIDPCMKKRYSYPLFTTFLIILSLLPFQSAYTDEPFSSVDSIHDKVLNWYNLDPVTDKIQGAAVDRAYSEIPGPRVPQKKIIVAVIDGGVDIHHSDLRGKIWKKDR